VFKKEQQSSSTKIGITLYERTENEYDRKSDEFGNSDSEPDERIVDQKYKQRRTTMLALYR